MSKTVLRSVLKTKQPKLQASVFFYSFISNHSDWQQFSDAVYFIYLSQKLTLFSSHSTGLILIETPFSEVFPKLTDFFYLPFFLRLYDVIVYLSTLFLPPNPLYVFFSCRRAYLSIVGHYLTLGARGMPWKFHLFHIRFYRITIYHELIQFNTG